MMETHRTTACESTVASENKSLSRGLNLALFAWIIYTAYRFGYSAVQAPGFIPFDFSVLYKAVDRFFSGEAVYLASDASPYKYSPTFLYIFKFFFHLLPRPLAWFLWVSSSITAWVWACRLLLTKDSAFSQLKKPANAYLAVGIGAVASWHGYLEHFSYGQTDMLIISGFIFALCIKKEWISAVLLAFCILTKPATIVFLTPLAIGGQFKLFAKATLATAFFFLLPILHLGPTKFGNLLSDWYIVLRDQQTTAFYIGNLNQSLAATLARLLHRPEWVQSLIASVIGLSAMGCGFLFFSWTIQRLEAAKKAYANDKSIWICATISLYLLISPLSWRWMTFAWLPLAALLFSRKETDPFFKWFGIPALTAVLFLQQNIAKHFGIHEIDELSWLGFYTLVSVCLFALFGRLLTKKPLKRTLETQD